MRTRDPAKYGSLEHPKQKYGRWLPSRVGPAQRASGRRSQSPGIVAFLVGTVETEIPLYRLKEFGFILTICGSKRNPPRGRRPPDDDAGHRAIEEIGVKQVRLDTVMPKTNHARTCSKKSASAPPSSKCFWKSEHRVFYKY